LGNHLAIELFFGGMAGGPARFQPSLTSLAGQLQVTSNLVPILISIYYCGARAAGLDLGRFGVDPLGALNTYIHFQHLS
jgi:hypothetical protein